jgi:3-carboxy-cis,cis-muconate cycloisomerase
LYIIALPPRKRTVIHAPFDEFLTNDRIAALFDAPALVQAMLDMEAALAQAQAAQGLVPATAAQAIAQAARVEALDLPALMQAGRRAGSLAIPLVKMLTAEVARVAPEAARHVHKGSTSQDVLDTAMARQSRRGLDLILQALDAVLAELRTLARTHAGTPVLARTLMQPATVTTAGFKFAQWLGGLQRARAALARQGEQALAVQLGGAVGTLAALGEQGPAVRAAMAQQLGLRDPGACWHTQRDDWVRLGCELGVLAGSLGKVATDLALMCQGEIGELAEPTGTGRGGSSAMPHKRNPVSALMVLATAHRAPGQVATLLGCMGQAHERGLGDWQAELAEWPHLFLGVHGALVALHEALAGLKVDAARMLANIDSLQGLVFAEAATRVLAVPLGQAAAHHLMEQLSQQAVAEGRHLLALTLAHAQHDPELQGQPNELLNELRLAFDPHVAAQHAQQLTLALLGETGTA